MKEYYALNRDKILAQKKDFHKLNYVKTRTPKIKFDGNSAYTEKMKTRKLLAENGAKECVICLEEKLLECFSKNKGGIAGRHSKCKVCSKLYRAKHFQDNKEREVVRNKKWRWSNLDRARPMEAYFSAKRRAMKLEATPPWLTAAQLNEIKEIYIYCPIGFHVDHIVPLKGVNVRGLHVPWNLQYLSAQENMSKSNKF